MCVALCSSPDGDLDNKSHTSHLTQIMASVCSQWVHALYLRVGNLLLTPGLIIILSCQPDTGAGGVM